jgi:hypothetical protein
LNPTSVFDLLFMLVATVLTMLSLDTLHILAGIHLEKSLFIPVMVSAVFFWCGSMINVAFQIILESASHLIVIQDSINLLSQVSLLIGLSILTYGVFSYWKLTRQVKVPKHEQSKVKESNNSAKRVKREKGDSPTKRRTKAKKSKRKS